jgi:hypothetical protein
VIDVRFGHELHYAMTRDRSMLQQGPTHGAQSPPHRFVLEQGRNMRFGHQEISNVIVEPSAVAGDQADVSGIALL